MREFLHVDDLASAVLFALREELPEPFYNVGTGIDIEIRQLAQEIQEAVGHKGNVVWDTTKPDGTPRKLLDCSKISEIGFTAQTRLESGIKSTYCWFVSNGVAAYKSVGK